MHTVTLCDRTFEGKQAPDWATAVARFNERWYWEESLEQQRGHRFLSVNTDRSTPFKYDVATVTGFDASYHLPPLQQDDPLPPVPDSVMYNAGQGCRLEVATLPPNANYEARVRIGVFSNTLVYQGKCTCLEPDEALQLAHDLRRMAMKIKRDQKQEQAQ